MPAMIQNLTAAELLDSKVALTTDDVAFILGLMYQRGSRAGQPNRRRVSELVKAGRIAPIDPQVPAQQWRFATSTIKRYVGQVAA